MYVQRCRSTPGQNQHVVISSSQHRPLSQKLLLMHNIPKIIRMRSHPYGAPLIETIRTTTLLRSHHQHCVLLGIAVLEQLQIWPAKTKLRILIGQQKVESEKQARENKFVEQIARTDGRHAEHRAAEAKAVKIRGATKEMSR